MAEGTINGVATVIPLEPARVRDVWHDSTVMARWDWVHSIQSTNNPDTRAKRIVVACSKMNNGEKRPCCFNRSACCEPAVSKGGVLILSAAGEKAKTRMA